MESAVPPLTTTGSPGLIEELVVPFDATELTDKAQRRRRGVRSRVISLVITVVVLVLIYLFGGEEFRAAGFLAVFGIALGISVAWFIGYLVAYLRARRELAGMGQGVAVRIGRPGAQVAAVYAPWPEVQQLIMVKGRWGRSPRLELRRTSGEPASVPLNQISVHPATLDSTARAYSGGRHGVDLEALES